MIQLENKLPLVLLIFDGFGYREEKDGNAIAAANMPTWNALTKKFPHTLLHASGEAVGLPDRYMGNSEVGHLAIGSGRVIEAVLSRCNRAIDTGEFFENRTLISRFQELKNSGGALHLLGLLSDAGVHSHEKHLFALLSLAKKVGLTKVYIHPFLDGRDADPNSGIEFLKKLQRFCEKGGSGSIATIHGRFYAMDRDANWERTKKSYGVILGHGPERPCKTVPEIEEMICESYDRGVTDEFFEPVLLDKEGAVKEGDGVCFFNFRSDRAGQLTEFFLNRERSSDFVPLSFFISMTRYKEDFANFDNDILFEQPVIEHTLLDEIYSQGSKLGNNRVFVIAETEKYAHVTYFFRGKSDAKRENETRVLIRSLKVKNYVEHPEMSAQEITDSLVSSLRKDPAAFYLVNFANCDMVGHSGDFGATVKACEFLDRQLSVLYELVVERLHGTIVVVGDHGNAEATATHHTTNMVPFLFVNKTFEGAYRSFGEANQPARWGLANIAPFILEFIGLDRPKEMERPLELDLKQS